jgi:DNA-directed RNA polymerase subunit RPC12/RpoP
MDEPKKFPAIKCPHCEHDYDFEVGYTERCYARFDGERGEFLEDGRNVQEHHFHFDDVWCSACNKEIVLTPEQIAALEQTL